MTIEQLETLLSDMTLEEKVYQLVQLTGQFYNGEAVITGPADSDMVTKECVRQAGSVLNTVGAKNIKGIQKEYMQNQSHHIPLLFMADIINGYKTIYPIPLAQGCSFDPEIVEKAAQEAAKEAAAAGLHVTFSPMADLVKDARWGRVMESTGEDAYLNGCMAEAMVKGYQGNDVKEKGRIAACVKHFAAYGAPTAGREYNNVELSETTLFDEYLPAYQAAIHAGAKMVMSAFNTLNRVPCTGNEWLMRKILREDMEFEGVLISDWAAIEQMILHGTAENLVQAAQIAMNAGVDIDMMTSVYADNLANLIKEGTVSQRFLDDAVRRVLNLKNDLGLFENPYKDADEEDEQAVILCDEHRKTALTLAEESFVLLKNEGVLPLKKEDTHVFLGPYTDNKEISGAWSFYADIEQNITIREAVEEKGTARNACFETMCGVFSGIRQIKSFQGDLDIPYLDLDLDENLKKMEEKIKNADTIVLALGEHYAQSGEAASRTEIQIPNIQMDLLKKVHQWNSNIVVVLFSGRPLDISGIVKYSKAVLAVWFPGIEGGAAIADVLYGDAEPGGRLTMSFPACAGQCPVFYNELPTGRPFKGQEKERFVSRYIDAPNAPLYPFGYGMTYTSFLYSKVKLSNDILTETSVITVNVTVENNGSRPGTEVVQMYIQDMAGSVSRPLRELKGFRRIHLAPGEKKNVEFVIEEEMLRFYNANLKYESEAGKFRVYVGGDSTRENSEEFTLVRSQEA